MVKKRVASGENEVLLLLLVCSGGLLGGPLGTCARWAQSKGLIDFPSHEGELCSFPYDANHCLSSMDEAREAADFPKLTKAALFPMVKAKEQDEFLQSICETLLEEDTAQARNTETSKGTLAIHRRNGDADLDCSAAVKDWQGGFNSFGGNPPVKEESDEYSDLDDKARSFVALYNPSEKIKGECQVIVCEKKAVETQNQRQGAESAGPEDKDKKEDLVQDEVGAAPGAGLQPEQQGPEPEEEAADKTEGKTASALVCLTFPDALDKTPLFS
ncbi:hypothetical protein Emag_004120 [Eimeria magna]